MNNKYNTCPLKVAKKKFSNVKTMRAVVNIIGKQYKVQSGDRFLVDRIKGEENTEVIFEEVLMTIDGDSITTGVPLIADAVVTAKIAKQCRGKKIKIVKFKRRKNYKKTQGHRQDLTLIEIIGISKAEIAKKAATAASTKDTAAKVEKPITEKAKVAKKQPAVKASATKKPVAKVAPEKVASAKVTPAKVTPAKVTPAKVTSAKVASAKVTPAKVTPAKVAPAKVTPAKVTPAKVKATKASSAKKTETKKDS